jgi:hypothetical protein
MRSESSQPHRTIPPIVRKRTAYAKATVPGAKELELIVKMIGGVMLYLPDSMQWSITFPIQNGRVVQLRIDEGTPLEEAKAAVALAYSEHTSV